MLMYIALHPTRNSHISHLLTIAAIAATFCLPFHGSAECSDMLCFQGHCTGLCIPTLRKFIDKLCSPWVLNLAFSNCPRCYVHPWVQQERYKTLHCYLAVARFQCASVSSILQQPQLENSWNLSPFQCVLGPSAVPIANISWRKKSQLNRHKV